MATSRSSSNGHAGSAGVLVLRSEYATVRVAWDGEANGDRLAITDLRSGRTTHFDPLELEALVWADHDELTPFLDPRRRWPDED